MRGMASAYLALAACLVAAGACRRPKSEPQDEGQDARIVAKVDGEKVRSGLFAAYMRDNVNLTRETSRAPGSGESGEAIAINDDVKSRLLDRFLLEHALFLRAKNAGVQVDEPGLDKFARGIGLGPLSHLHEGVPLTEREYLRAYLEDCYLVKRYLDDVVLSGEKATEGEAKARYDRDSSRFQRPDRYRLHVMHLDDANEAKVAHAQLARDPSRFPELVRKMSEGLEGEQGKDLGMWRAPDLPETIGKAVAAREQGQVTEVVPDGDGAFNIYYLAQKMAGGTVPFAEVRDRLLREVEREKRTEALARFLAGIRREAQIEIHEENLDFRYVPVVASAASSPESSPESSQSPSPQGGPS